MKIGLYFGSFNPVHHGHLIIANQILNNLLVDKIWFVVSPQNPLKQSAHLLNQYHRLHLVRTATEEDRRIEVSDIEFNMPIPSYTIDTLTYLEEKFANDEFYIIIGSDSFQNIHKWKNYESLLKNYSFIIYTRPGFEVDKKKDKQFTVIKTPLIEISSTEIRKYIYEKKSIRYLVPEKVREEIEKGGYYKKPSEQKSKQ